MDTSEHLPKGKCANCGKEIPIRDIRTKTGQYCNRICASQRNFKKRYRGTMSGPADRPTFNTKGEKI